MLFVILMPLITEGIEIICMATKKKTVSKKKSVNKKKVIKRNPSAGGNTTKKKLPTATRLQIKRGRPGTGLGLFAMDFFKKGEMIATSETITAKIMVILLNQEFTQSDFRFCIYPFFEINKIPSNVIKNPSTSTSE